MSFLKGYSRIILNYIDDYHVQCFFHVTYRKFVTITHIVIKIKVC